MKTKRAYALLAAVALLAGALVAAGCGDSGHSSSQSSTGNATDAAFINDMTSHHRGAIEMAQLATDHADHPQIKTLAKNIISAQQSEMDMMGSMKHDMAGMHSSDMHGSGHMGMSAKDMGMDMNMSTLGMAHPFDKAFIDAMIPHHQGAIRMARQLLAKGENPQLQKMAKDIISAQTKEIAQMKAWRKAWYGSGSMAMGG